jgi:hypothetical protein
MAEGLKPEAPSLGTSEQSPPLPSGRRESTPPESVVPASGKRSAFRDVRRQLTDDELKNSGVQKLLLDMLQESDDERERLTSYVDRFHDADKVAAVLREEVKTHTKIEVFFGVGVGLGGTIIGLSPFFWGIKIEYGIITAFVGFLAMIGSTIGKLVKK